MNVYPEKSEAIFEAFKKKYKVKPKDKFLPYQTVNNVLEVCDYIRLNNPLMFHALCDLLVGLFCRNEYVVLRDLSMFVSAFSKDKDTMYIIKKTLSIESEILNSIDKRVDEIHKFLALVIFLFDSQELITTFTAMSQKLRDVTRNSKERSIQATFVFEGYDMNA